MEHYLRLRYMHVFREVNDSLKTYLKWLDSINNDEPSKELMGWERTKEIKLTMQVETVNGKEEILKTSFYYNP